MINTSLTPRDFLKFSAAAWSHKVKPGSLPESWSMVTNSDQQHLSKNGYYGMAFVSNETKELVVAHSGHSFNFSPYDLFWDTVSAVQVMFGMKPTQLQHAQQFADQVINNPEYSGYKVHFTGQSLGGALAELNKIAFQDSIDCDAVTFESIGSADVAQKLYGVSHTDNVVTYNAQSNILTNHQQVGEVHVVQEHDHSFCGIDSAINNHSIRSLMKWFDPETGHPSYDVIQSMETPLIEVANFYSVHDEL